MVKLHLLIATLSSVCVYLVLAYVFGVSGVQNERELLSYRERLEVNIENLSTRNAELEGRIHDLQRDRELLRVYARSLGFFAADERRLVVESWVDVTEPMSPGSLVYRTITFNDNRATLRLTAAIIGIGVFGLLSVLGTDSTTKRRSEKTGQSVDQRKHAA